MATTEKELNCGTRDRKARQAFPRMKGGGRESEGNIGSAPGFTRRERIREYIGLDFLDHQPVLMNLASRLMSSELGWDLPIARWVVGRSLTVTPEDQADNGKGMPSALVLLWGDEPVGISTQKSIEIETREGEIKTVTQHFLRAIMPDFRTMGWGGRFLEELLKIHQDEYYAHCSQAVATFYVNMQSGLFEHGTYAPFQIRHNVNSVRRDLLIGYWNRRKVFGKTVDESTGVSPKDFPQRNKNFRPELGHLPTEELFRLVTEEFGMEFPEDPNAPKDVGTDSLSAIARRR